MDDETGKFSSDMRLCFAHPFPATKIMFMPDKESNRPDLLATTADYLRLWHLTEDGVVLQKLLNNVRTRSRHCCGCVSSSQVLVSLQLRNVPGPRRRPGWRRQRHAHRRAVVLHQEDLCSTVLISARWHGCIGISL